MSGNSKDPEGESTEHQSVTQDIIAQEGAEKIAQSNYTEQQHTFGVGSMLIARHRKSLTDQFDAFDALANSKDGLDASQVKEMILKLRATACQHYKEHATMIESATSSLQQQNDSVEDRSSEMMMLKVNLEHVQHLLASERQRTRHLEAAVVEKAVSAKNVLRSESHSSISMSDSRSTSQSPGWRFNGEACPYAL